MDSTRNLAILIIAAFFSFLFGYYYGVAYWNSGPAGVMLGCLLFVVSMAVLFVEKKFVNLAGVFYGGRAANWTRREMLQGDITRTKVLMTQKNYEAALKVVNQVLTEDAEFPEALYLKARILWDGYQNAGDARKCLERILNRKPRGNTPDAEELVIRRWAQSLLDALP